MVFHPPSWRPPPPPAPLAGPRWGRPRPPRPGRRARGAGAWRPARTVRQGSAPAAPPPARVGPRWRPAPGGPQTQTRGGSTAPQKMSFFFFFRRGGGGGQAGGHRHLSHLRHHRRSNPLALAGVVQDCQEEEVQTDHRQLLRRRYQVFTGSSCTWTSLHCFPVETTVEGGEEEDRGSPAPEPLSLSPRCTHWGGKGLLLLREGGGGGQEARAQGPRSCTTISATRRQALGTIPGAGCLSLSLSLSLNLSPSLPPLRPAAASHEHTLDRVVKLLLLDLLERPGEEEDELA